MDECNSLFAAFKESVTAYYLAMPPREDEEASVSEACGSDCQLMKGLKEVLRSQDQELKQLRVQVSLGGSVGVAMVCEE